MHSRLVPIRTAYRTLKPVNFVATSTPRRYFKMVAGREATQWRRCTALQVQRHGREEQTARERLLGAGGRRGTAWLTAVPRPPICEVCRF
eukprot:gene1587-biopygen4865